jgi:transposase
VQGHCLADDCGRPVALALTPGNVADISMAVPLLNAAAPSRRLIADKAYDADSLRRWLTERRIEAIIPSTASRRTSYPLNRRIYRRRNVIERLFCRLKTGAASPPDTPATTSQASLSLPLWLSGSNEYPT